MSDKLTREINIKLNVDGKEVTGTLQIADEKIQKLINSHAKYQSETIKATGTTSQFNNILVQFKSELLEASGSSENFTESVADFIRMNGLSENQISDVINALKQEKTALNLNSAEYAKHNQAIETMTNAYGNVRAGSGALTNTMQGTSSGVQAMSQTMGQLGWAIGDADMFLVNFRMGMMSIGNNIPMIAQGFGYVKNKIKDTGETMKDVLVASIKGPGGVMIAINGLMFLMNTLAFLWEKQKKEVKENAEEVKNLANEYENLSTVQLNKKKLELEVEKGSLEDERKLLTKTTTKTKLIGDTYYEVTETKVTDKNRYDEYTQQIGDVQKRLDNLSGIAQKTKDQLRLIWEGKFNLNSINQIKEAIRLLNRELETAGTQTRRDEISAKIEELETVEKKYRNESNSTTTNEITNKQLITRISNSVDLPKADLVGEKVIEVPVELVPVKVGENTDIKDPWKPFEDTAWATAQNTAIQSIGQSIQSYIGKAFRKVFGEADNLFTNLLSSVASALAGLLAQQSALGLFNLVTGGVGGFLGGFLNIGSKAEGGLIDGPGTETSDSIPARLSKGEFVVKAKATKAFYPMLEAINNFDKTHVRPIIQGFANGGLVGRSSQIISSLASSTSNVNVNLTMNPVELKQSGYDMRGVLKLIERKEGKYR